ncbi:hypothetical protein LTR78_006991 [Recurvomyces mirabilis]|uniref:Gfd2/YDR514C-like C-terminal domain-containing protein n=1 Tax=Recurvomyces mirabilis TaxID=574656 RepID=A0AAE0WK21_9PEZI|nr:hypothetical protein LTR78_006991 [Recurvomyces mirabilis]KAK5153375.1 hypothetical protein LTS14_007544 [Recurvomyces mirabilis]
MPPRPIKGPAALERARKRAATSVKALKEARERRQCALDRSLTTVCDNVVQPSKTKQVLVKATSPSPSVLQGDVRSYQSRIPTLTAAKASQTSYAETQPPNLKLRPIVKSSSPITSRFQRLRERTTRQINSTFTQVRSRWQGYHGYATIFELRDLLGLPGSTRAGQGPAPNSVLIAIDTEFERLGLVNHVVEIGITVLRLKDLVGVEPGTNARAWLAKSEHRHMVIDVTQQPKTRMSTSLFGKSHFIEPAGARRMVRAILQACADGKPLPETYDLIDIEPIGRRDPSIVQPAPQADLWLVGQSIRGDLGALAGPPVALDITKPAALGGVAVGSVIDLLHFGQHAVSLGAPLRSLKLGRVVRSLGADAVYHDPKKRTIVGWHNASNDAAYSMMALLLYAVRWDKIIASARPAARMEPARMEPARMGPARMGPARKGPTGWFGAVQSDSARGVAREGVPRKDRGRHYVVWRRAAVLLAAGGGIAGISVVGYESFSGN